MLSKRRTKRFEVETVRLAERNDSVLDIRSVRDEQEAKPLELVGTR
ncbi:hypothetical protein WDV93_24030 [Pantoea ananatis]